MTRFPIDEVEAIIAAAVARRSAHLQTQTLDAWRVLNGPADGAPAGLTLDRYGDWLVLSAREHLGEALVVRWANAGAAQPCRGLVLKWLRRPATRSSSGLFAGEPPPPWLIVREQDARFRCVLDGGMATGLFLDHRETRFLARTYASGAEVLNLFSYTGAFSVHAALAGAARVTSVDAARRALRWGRENMAESGLDPDRHRWFPDDVTAHLERAVRRGLRYGMVILDPPAFGHADDGLHALGRDLDTLMTRCLTILEPGGTLIVSTHLVALGAPELRAVAARAAEAVGRPVSVLAELGLPAWDHPTFQAAEGVRSEGSDRGSYLKTLVLRAC